MSNRNKWAHWRDPKPDKLWRFKQYPLGIAFVSLGSLLFLSGWMGLHDQVLWFRGFNWVFGSPVIVLTVSLLFVGGAFVIAGVTLFIFK
jgi:hypothetical protein